MTAPTLRPHAVARPRLRTAVTWLLRIVLASLFLGAGFSKLVGEPAMVQMFDMVGAGQWLRYFVGACEVAGAVGVLIPRLSALASGGLALLMLGASITNVALLDASPVLTIVVFVVAVLTAWLGLRRPTALEPRRR